MREVIEQHITDAATQDNAERDPNNKVVEIGDAQRGWAAPQSWRGNDRARVEPAADDPDDISERIPAHRERPDRDQHRIDCRKRNDGNNHKTFPDPVIQTASRPASGLQAAY